MTTSRTIRGWFTALRRRSSRSRSARPSVLDRAGLRATRKRFIEALDARTLLSLAPVADPSVLVTLRRDDLVSPAWFGEVAQQAPLNQAASIGALSAGTASVTPPSTGNTLPLPWGEGWGEGTRERWIVRLTTEAAAQARSPAGTVAFLSSAAGQFRVIRGLGLSGMVLVEADAAAEAALRANPNVASVEPDAIIRAQTIPNDPGFVVQNGLNNTGQEGGTFDADIDAPEAWNITSGSSSVVVGVIDSGIDYNHPDLAANIWTNPGEIAGNGVDDDHNGYVDDVHGWDFVNNDGDPMDDNRHGTHVAGTIAAVGNNSLGVSGVAWQASLMALKFLGADNSGTTANAILAINYATTMRQEHGVNVRVLNNSWGGSGSTALRSAIYAAGQQDILFVRRPDRRRPRDDPQGGHLLGQRPRPPRRHDRLLVRQSGRVDVGDSGGGRGVLSYGRTSNSRTGRVAHAPGPIACHPRARYDAGQFRVCGRESEADMTPNSQLPTPNSQLPTPNSQLPTPNSQGTPHVRPPQPPHVPPRFGPDGCRPLGHLDRPGGESDQSRHEQDP